MTTEDNKSDLGKILKQQRLTLELTLQELARASGVSPSHLARIERGSRFPSAHILKKIAQPLGFEESDLFAHAGFLSPKAYPEVETPTAGRLDPYVARVLSQEPVEIQRTVIAILSIFKNMTKGSPGRIGFSEYIHQNYPELDEDVVTMIEDIIKRSQG